MRFFFSAVLLILCSSLYGQTGYKLDFKVKGWKDTTAYLGYYQGESTFLRDTAHVDSHGDFTFDGKKQLPQGVYFVVLKKVKIFEFVVSTKQQFKLETSSDDYYKNMKVYGDEDNQLFLTTSISNPGCTLRLNHLLRFCKTLR